MHAVLSVASVSAIASASAAAAAAAERRSCGSYDGSQQKPALSDFGARWRDVPRPQERLSGDPQGCCETSLFTTTAKSSRYRPRSSARSMPGSLACSTPLDGLGALI